MTNLKVGDLIEITNSTGEALACDLTIFILESLDDDTIMIPMTNVCMYLSRNSIYYQLLTIDGRLVNYNVDSKLIVGFQSGHPSWYEHKCRIKKLE